MKEIGKERKIAIIALIVAVLMLTVAFAAMSRTLKINGTAKVDSAAWDIPFKSASMIDKKGDAREASKPNISEDGINLTLKVGLRKPKDEKTVKIVIRYKDIADESLLAKEAYDVPLTFKINYIQKGFGTGGATGGTQEEPAITVDENGMITSFNEEKLKNDEGYVVVPATTETGEKIISIDGGSFAKHNVRYVDFRNRTTGEEIYGYVILDEENHDAIEEILIAESGGLASNTNNRVKPVNFIANETSSDEVQQMKVETGSGYTIYSKSEWDEYLKEAEGDDTYYHQLFYEYVNLDTKESEYSIVTIEKLDLSNAIYLTTIDGRAFNNNKISKVTIPSSVTTIEIDAFYNNPNLTEIIIKRANSDGMTLGENWNGTATIKYDPN